MVHLYNCRQCGQNYFSCEQRLMQTLQGERGEEKTES